LEGLPLGLPGERLSLPLGWLGESARGSEEKVRSLREVDEEKMG